MNNENTTKSFKEVQVQNYVRELAENGVEAKQYQKFARVKAERGIEGQEVITKMANGLEETRNVVTLDEKTGNAGWIVTNPDGEQYIVPDSKFTARYDVENCKDGIYDSKYSPIKAMEIDDNITFMSPWGEPMNIEKGGFLVINSPDDIYGIQRDEFYNTYQDLETYNANRTNNQNAKQNNANIEKHF